MEFPDLELYQDQLCTKKLTKIRWNEPIEDIGHIAKAEVFLKNVTEHDFGITAIVPPDPRMRFSLTSSWVYPSVSVKLTLIYEIPKSEDFKEFVKNLPTCGKIEIKGYYLVRE